MTKILYWVLVKKQGRWQRARNFASELLEFSDLDACLQVVKNHLLLEQPPEISIRKVRQTTPDTE